MFKKSAEGSKAYNPYEKEHRLWQQNLKQKSLLLKKPQQKKPQQKRFIPAKPAGRPRLTRSTCAIPVKCPRCTLVIFAG
jgi:hypothetical protein